MTKKEDGPSGSSSCGQRRGRKPLSVFESAIYLRNLPPGIGRAALICRYIWSCRPAAVPAVRRRTASWALTPRFHPYRPETAVIFCYGWREVTPTCAFRSGMPCPVRTFLPCGRQIAPPLVLDRKVREIFHCTQICRILVYLCKHSRKRCGKFVSVQPNRRILFSNRI